MPIFREPRGRAYSRSERDQRFRNDYPPEWDRCTECGGSGRVEADGEHFAAVSESGRVFQDHEGRYICGVCKGMGSLKARVRLMAGHRCIRCKHPYIPKGDAKMLGVEASGLHDCETCGGDGEVGEDERVGEIAVPAVTCSTCKGTGKVWTPWSACDEQCTHKGPVRVLVPEGDEPVETGEWMELSPLRPVGELIAESNGQPYEAKWRILTVHHFSGDKSDCRWGNLGALCQRCHLLIQGKVVLEQVYPHEHSEWFKPHAAWWYAWSYLGEDLSRGEVMERLDELLALELDAGHQAVR